VWAMSDTCAVDGVGRGTLLRSGVSRLIEIPAETVR
jgi:hypothetical protein